MTFKPKSYEEARTAFKPLKRAGFAPHLPSDGFRPSAPASQGKGSQRSTVRKRPISQRPAKPLNRVGPRTKEWKAVWAWLKPRLEAAERTQCEFQFMSHNCWGRLDPAHSKKRRLWVGNDIYAVAIACQNIHQILDEQMTHEEMEEVVMMAINRHGGLILP